MVTLTTARVSGPGVVTAKSCTLWATALVQRRFQAQRSSLTSFSPCSAEPDLRRLLVEGGKPPKPNQTKPCISCMLLKSLLEATHGRHKCFSTTSFCLVFQAAALLNGASTSSVICCPF